MDEYIFLLMIIKLLINESKVMSQRSIQEKVLSKFSYWNEQSSKILERKSYMEVFKKADNLRALNIHTHMTPAELSALYRLGKGVGNSINALEIGSYLGASACYIAAALADSGGHLFCVDTWQNQTMPEGELDTFLEFQTNIKGFEKHIIMVRKYSQELIYSDINRPLNLVFIDGDHSYNAVKADFEIVSPWIIEGGILAMHDCTYFESVSRALGDILATGKWQLGGNVDSLVWLRKIGTKTHFFPNPMQISDTQLAHG
jgi:predicted O-methyltransferase YrrM